MQQNTKNLTGSLLEQLLQGVAVPQGYHVDDTGICRVEENKEGDLVKTQISYTPLVAAAFERDGQDQEWRTVIRFINLDGKLRQESWESSLLGTPAILAELRNRGCKFAFGKGIDVLILSYLNEFYPEMRYRRVSRLGWFQWPKGNYSFVLPDNTIADDPEDPICYNAGHNGQLMQKVMTPSGTFDAWKSEVAALTAGNPLLMFCLSAAFAGPLLLHLGAETGGFHLHGQSSQGKTTAMQVAASVWGNGAAPTNTSSAPFIRTWRSTSNAMEGLASAHNDLLLILDEIGQSDVFDFQRIVYDLASGQGKSRLNKQSNLAESKAWRTIFLSTGEIGAQEKMESGHNNKAKAGQLLRMIDISTDGGIINTPPDKMGQAEFADHLKRACAQHYGWAGPAFVRLIAEGEDIPVLMGMIVNLYAECKEVLCRQDLEPEQRRAMNRFALVMAAGVLAVDLEVLPLDRDEIMQAVSTVSDIWLQSTRVISDAARAVMSVRDFIASQGNRFESSMVGTYFDDPKGHQVGFKIKHDEETLYLFTVAGFKEAINGVSAEMVCRELKALNFLHTNNPGKNKARFQINKGDKRPFYAIRESILAYDPEGDEASDLDGQPMGDTVDRVDS